MLHDMVLTIIFILQVNLLSQVQHPNILAMIGFCPQLSCIVYEYMHNGTLHDALFSTGRSWKQKNQPLNWHARIRIADEICSALGFLHKVKPNPVIHGNLKPSKILLDRFNVAKIYGLKDPWSHDKPDITLDIRDFGNLVLQLLSGKNWNTTKDTASTIENLDGTAGEWPVDLATELSEIATRCLSKHGSAEEYITTMLVREIKDVKKRADQLVAKGELPVPDEEAAGAEDLCNVPGTFLCPIYQVIYYQSSSAILTEPYYFIRYSHCFKFAGCDAESTSCCRWIFLRIGSHRRVAENRTRCITHD